MGCSTPDAVSEPAGAGGDRRPGSWLGQPRRPPRPRPPAPRHGTPQPRSPRPPEPGIASLFLRDIPERHAPGGPAHPGRAHPVVPAPRQSRLCKRRITGAFRCSRAGCRFSPQFQRSLTADAQARLSASSAPGWRRARLPAKRRKAGGRRSARCVRMGRAGLLGRRIADVQSLPFTRIIMTEPWGSANRPAWLFAGLRGGPTTSTGPPRAICSHALGGRWGTSASSANCYGTRGSAKAAPPGTRSPGPITQSQATLVRPQLRNRARFGRPQTLCHAQSRQLRTANRMQIPPVLCVSMAGARRGMSGLPFAGAVI